jgi:hypothetical protein
MYKEKVNRHPKIDESSKSADHGSEEKSNLGTCGEE